MPAAFLRSIHDAPGQLVLAVTGGGSGAISALLSVPGASRTVLEAIVPYAPESLAAWLGSRPDQFCAPRTARAMAMAGFQHGLRYLDESGEKVPLAGIGCTASLASDRPKRGPHRAHVALQTADLTATWSLELIKDRRGRAEEEQIVSHLILNVVAEAKGVTERLPLPLVEPEHVEYTRTSARPQWRELLLGQVDLVGNKHDGAALIGPRQIIFPGAFNPLHAGHRRMAEIAAEILAAPVAFEISIQNVDKPMLDYTEMEYRSGQFQESDTVWFTRAATFLEKSRLFPNATFVLGSDTMARVADPRYYHHDPGACQNALETIAQRGCRFLVFGRQTTAGFQSLADLRLPEVLRAISQEVPAAVFREDISSTVLRQTSEA